MCEMLDRIERLNMGRAPGPWTHAGDAEDFTPQTITLPKTYAPGFRVMATVESGYSGDAWESYAYMNAAFIAEAANNMAELIRLARIGAQTEDFSKQEASDV